MKRVSPYLPHRNRRCSRVSSGVAEFRSHSIGLGIGGMRQRVKELGGKLRLENTNPGTRLEGTLPVGS